MSRIEWTDETWNPVTGCTKVSAGCKHCYAESVARRFWRGRPFSDVRLHHERLDTPLRWRKPRRVFVNSMSDLFHEDVDRDFILRVFGAMADCRQHTFQVLTKRPQRMHELLTYWMEAALVLARHLAPHPWPLPNVWLGVSVEDQATADERIPLLLDTPAAVRFLSCEPLLGPIDLLDYIPDTHDGHPDPRGGPWPNWVIVGGESGPKARPCDVEWIRSIVHQCREAGVPAFCKQLGAHVRDRNDAGFHGCEPWEWPAALEEDDRIEHLEEGYQGAPVRLHLKDRKGGDMAEWPPELRVREWPARRT